MKQIGLVWMALGFGLSAQQLSMPQGDFLGKVEVGAVSLRLALHLKVAPDGAATGTMDSLDQGVNGMPIRAITFENGVLKLSSGPNLNFEGTVNAAGTEINGHLKQGAMNMPLVFRKVDKIEGPRRPQHPVRPFPYNEEDVTFENQAAGVKIAGTLTWPRTGTGPFPTAILLTGSGPQDRDETLFEHKPFLVLSDFLTRIGFAVLRTDDRGVGKTTGNLARSTLDDLAADAVVMAQFLRTRKEVDPKRIGFIGHSEGGIVGPMAAAKAEAAFLILLAGPGVRGDELLYEQGQAVLKAAGAPPNVLQRQTRIQHLLLETVLAERDPVKLEAKLRDAVALFKSEISPQELAQTPGFDQQMEAEIRRVLLPPMLSLVRHDPRPVLKALKCPILALDGTLDTQVPSRQNLPAIASALAEGGVEDFATVSLPKLNHLFQTAKTGGVGEYGQLEETIAPIALETIGAWLSSRFVK